MLKWGLGFLCAVVCVSLTVFITRQRSELQQLEDEFGYDEEGDRGTKRKFSKTSLLIRVHDAQLNMSARQKEVLEVEEAAELVQSYHVQCLTRVGGLNYWTDIKEKERADIEAAQKPEVEAWQKELDKLKEDLAAKSPVCDHLKDDPEARKLCGIEEKKEEEKKEEKKEEEKKE